MPQFFYKNGITYIKKHKKRSFLFGFVFIMLLCIIIFNVSDLISSIITNSKSIFFQNKIEIPSYSAYGVSVAETSNKEQAQTLSEQVKSLGGAGVVYSNGNYYIFASMYDSLNQAKEVESNLISLNNECKIITFEVDYIFKNISCENITEIVSSIKYLKTIFKTLCEVSVNFDKGQMSVLQVKNKVKEVLTVLLNNNLKIKDNCTNKNLNEIINKTYNNEKKLLYELLNFNTGLKTNSENNLNLKLQFASLIKQTCFETIFLNMNLAKNINNL